MTYLNALHESRLTYSAQKPGNGMNILQKPNKVYLKTPNLIALADKQTDIRNVRETFFANQFQRITKQNLSEASDFLVDEKYTFEVGGKDKGKKQIATLENAYIVADDIEYGMGNKILLCFSVSCTKKSYFIHKQTLKVQQL